MLVFIDTNILYKDFYMENNRFKLINNITTIVLGEIVVDEVCKKFREYLVDNITELNKRANNINKVIQEPLNINDIDVESEVQKYRDFLEMHLIEHGMITPEEYPTISHKEVVARAIMGKKPFKPNGKDGYRDYLVWLTCLELAKKYSCEEVHFITENIIDFSVDNKDNKKILHDDLLEDLDKYGISRSRFFYWTNLTDFFDNCIKQKIDKLKNEERIKSQIEANSKYSDELQSFISTEIIGSHLSSNEVLLPSRNNILKEVDSWDAEIDDITNIDDNKCLLEINIDSICVIEGEMLISEYNELQKESNFDDWMWDIVVVSKKNNDVIIVKIMMQLYIHINGEYCISDDSISILQLDYIEDSYCDFCYY